MPPGKLSPPLKICLYYRPTSRPWGGANSFIVHLAAAWRRLGVVLTHDINSDYDVLLLNGAFQAPGVLLNLKGIRSVLDSGYTSLPARWVRGGGRKRPRTVVLRLDGLRKVYAGTDTSMDRIQLEAAGLAHHIIFQSGFALDCFRAHGYRGNEFSIVHNGVDTDIFSPAVTGWDGSGPMRFVAASWSENAAKGHALVRQLAEIPDVTVDFIGRWPAALAQGRVHCLGSMAQGPLAAALRRYHALFFPAQKEACSNTLVEGLASGLPPLYIDSGSNAEVAGGAGMAFSSGTLAEDTAAFRAAWPRLRENLIADRERFSINRAAIHYLEVIRDAHASRSG